jgi:hypothetical protein
LGVALAVGVGGDVGAGVGVELVLVDDPVEGGAVAEAVVEGLRESRRMLFAQP